MWFVYGLEVKLTYHWIKSETLCTSEWMNLTLFREWNTYFYRVAHWLGYGLFYFLPTSALADGKLADLAEQACNMVEYLRSMSTQPNYPTRWGPTCSIYSTKESFDDDIQLRSPNWSALKCIFIQLGLTQNTRDLQGVSWIVLTSEQRLHFSIRSLY